MMFLQLQIRQKSFIDCSVRSILTPRNNMYQDIHVSPDSFTWCDVWVLCGLQEQHKNHFFFLRFSSPKPLLTHES